MVSRFWGALALNALLLLGVAFYILYEAWQRLTVPQEIQSGGMLAIAVVGLVVNLLSMRLLTTHKDQSLNLKGAYLEVWSDMLGSLAVIVGAAIIWLTGLQWIDSLLAVGIGFMVFPRTWVQGLRQHPAGRGAGGNAARRCPCCDHHCAGSCFHA
ncbi:cation diffusion facilitator family transporter [Sinorhizobium fredii]|uniref:Cobalt-zinc-cadmium resistance protein CzcD n=1 Tax=Sinorhizobium fredii (strain USDA 257) TaxID=1185652 RepID=I3X0T7_SINF2|nr:cobalt-zinc-cadmium resistance protein CzcD [Sinorhizobium fredii USDA 257]